MQQSADEVSWVGEDGEVVLGNGECGCEGGERAGVCVVGGISPSCLYVSERRSGCPHAVAD
jgi:hypothetical protein